MARAAVGQAAAVASALISESVSAALLALSNQPIQQIAEDRVEHASILSNIVLSCRPECRRSKSLPLMRIRKTPELQEQ
jgi:hypothetical protein